MSFVVTEMVVRIGSNIASLKTQRQLTKASNELSSVYERLSSGQRINKASDDAAGLSIAESLRSDARVFSQGVRNLNDGISLFNIADSALQSLTDIVVRLKELAEQSANATYSTTQRAAIDKEAQALSKEYLRIAQTTTFNGINLFNGSTSGVNLQAGHSVLSGRIGGAIGDGTLTAGTSFNVNYSPAGFAVGDLNNDGSKDFVTMNGNSGFSVFMGSASGAVSMTANYIVPGFPREAKLGDFNNDGKLDLLLTNYDTNGGVNLFLGNGDGTFGNARSFANSSTGILGVETGDFNNDGNLDFASLDAGNNSFGIYLGNGNGSFSLAASKQTGGNNPYDIRSGDFNGDGILDLVNTNFAGTLISVNLGRGDGTFGNASNYSLGTNPFRLDIGDLNGDNILDLAVAIQGTDRLQIMIGNGDGSFTQGQSMLVGDLPSDVSIGDMNGDGFNDLVFSSVSEGTVNISFGSGNGTFGSRVSYTVGNEVAGIELTDLNNDGVLDVLSGTFTSENRITIQYGNSRDGVGPLLAFDLKSATAAKNALSVFGHKLNQLTAQRGQFGAFQARVETAKNHLQTVTLAYQQAESRIRDADIAAESANLVRLQILQQASSAILGQANLQPQLALKLLKGGG